MDIEAPKEGEHDSKKEDDTSEDSNREDNVSHKSANTSRTTSIKHSFQQKLKNSSNFLAKTLQNSTDTPNDNESNIPSGLASALSSISSFTSSFSLNSHSNNNNTLSASNSGASLTIETASTITKLSHVSETKEDIFNKKATLERRNLIKLTKLIVKDLISASLAVNRTIEDTTHAVHLTNYFTLIDKVLKHGLKDNVFSSRSLSLWNALESLPKYLRESTLIAESVRSLPNTKTYDGKIKAWMRLAMMQKKLPEYFGELLANKNILLKNIYHDYAFMLSEESHVFAGLIIGVNVIDCNFFVKDANFDLMDDIIDLSPYLRSANSYDNDQDDIENIPTESDQSDSLKAVLDQKNYLEEWNKRLELNIQNLQKKINSLEEMNSKLEMEGKLNELRITKLKGGSSSIASEPTVASSITGAIKSFMNNSNNAPKTNVISAHEHGSEVGLDPGELIQSTGKVDTQSIGRSSQVSGLGELNPEDMRRRDDESKSTCSRVSNEDKLSTNRGSEASGERISKHQEQVREMEKELANLRERVAILEASYRSSLERIKVLERDLDVQTSINADKETTIKIYEKDIREKQDQVESLRNSLSDAKKLNSDLSERLNDTSAKLKERLKMVTNLQASLDRWKLENKNMATRLQDKLSTSKSLNSELDAAKNNIEELKRYNEKINDELRKERESGQSSSVTLESQTVQIARLVARIDELERETRGVIKLREQKDELEKRCKDYEQSLEEIGNQLRESRLEVENLKENSAVFLDSQWKDDKQVKQCNLCQQAFSVTKRKHHCRLCGNVFCQTCSDNKMELASSSKPVRVCDICHPFLLAKFVKTSTNSS